MNLAEIMSISGKPGLYKMISHTKTGMLVESMQDQKRFPVFAHEKISSLEEISIFTETDDIPLKEVFKKILDSESRILEDPAPLIVVSELADSSVNFFVRPWVNTGDYWDVKYVLTEKIKIALDDAGISIPYPQTDVHLHQKGE